MLRAYIIGALCMFIAGLLIGREWRDRSCELAEAKDHIEQSHKMVEAVEQARSVEHQRNERLHEIGTQYEAKRSENESLPSTVAGAIRDGSLQLRDDLATCHTQLLSEATAGAIQRDEAAQLRAEVAGAIVQVGADADDQLRACQAVVVEDRK